MKHDLKLDEDGEIDLFVYYFGDHNGPGCSRCEFSWCRHCEPKRVNEECPESERRVMTEENLAEDTSAVVDYLWYADEYDPRSAAKKVAYVLSEIAYFPPMDLARVQIKAAERVLVDFLEKDVLSWLPKFPGTHLATVQPSRQLAEDVAKILMDRCDDNPRGE